jgi:hypothetical protein
VAVADRGTFDSGSSGSDIDARVGSDEARV